MFVRIIIDVLVRHFATGKKLIAGQLSESTSCHYTCMPGYFTILNYVHSLCHMSHVLVPWFKAKFSRKSQRIPLTH